MAKIERETLREREIERERERERIHKEGINLRLLVNVVGSPVYEVSKFQENILKFAFNKDSHYTNNYFELVSELQSIKHQCFNMTGYNPAIHSYTHGPHYALDK